MVIRNENRAYHFLLFLLSPVLGLYYAIKTRSRDTIRWGVFVFTAIYGSLITISSLGGQLEGGKMYGSDGAEHWYEVYQHYQYLNFSVWWKELIAILSLAPKDTTNDDVYIHILSYLIGIFNIPGLFMTAVAVIYAYFYSGAIVKLLSYVNWDFKRNKFYIIFFSVILLLWKSPLDMQTVRTWTGMWVLIYAVLSYYETKKKKYLLLALTPPLIHIGFSALAIPVWLVLFSGFRNPKLYFILFVTSIFFSNVIAQTNLTQIVSQTELGASKVQAYYVDDEEQGENESSQAKTQRDERFYKTFERYKLHINVITGAVIFMYFFLRKNGFGRIENTLFSYGLATAAFANFFTPFFAVHNRGWNIAGVFILSLLLIFLSKQNFSNLKYSSLRIRLPFFIFIVAMIPYLLYQLSNFLQFTSVYVFFMPFVSWIESEMAITIRSFIGLFL